MFRKKNKEPEVRRTTARSSSTNVFSYYSNRSQPEIDRPRTDTFDQVTKTSNRNLRYLPTILAIVLIISAILYSLLLNASSPEIIPLTQSSSSVLYDNAHYAKKIAGILRSSPVNQTKITIDTKKMESEILSQMPELESVSVNIPLIGRKIVVQLSPTVPILAISTQNGSYVVGVNGKVLMELADFPEGQRDKLIHVNDLVIDDVSIGKRVIPLSTIEFIKDVEYQFSQKNLQIETVELPAVANELHVKPKGVDYKIKFNLQNDAREQVGTYFAVIDRISHDKALMPRSYVDVRVEGRAYYK